jgi:hypothetical protein
VVHSKNTWPTKKFRSKEKAGCQFLITLTRFRKAVRIRDILNNSITCHAIEKIEGVSFKRKEGRRLTEIQAVSPSGSRSPEGTPMERRFKPASPQFSGAGPA